jgi:hypothetical protein
MSITTEISVGEFLDKMTILQIKQVRIQDRSKQANIIKELKVLTALWQQSTYSQTDINEDLQQLSSVNEQLWDIEDDIRAKEEKREFDDRFIELARSVYIINDRRARIKKTINEKLGSGLVEEKSYTEY